MNKRIETLLKEIEEKNIPAYEVEDALQGILNWYSRFTTVKEDHANDRCPEFGDEGPYDEPDYFTD